MKQTAVEWLRQELLKRDMDILIKDLFEKAKEMEKEQIIKAYWAAYKEALHIGDKTADEYYNETFKSE